MKRALLVAGLVLCIYALYAGAQSNIYAKWGSGTSTVTRTLSANSTWKYILIAPDTQTVLVTVFGNGSDEVATDMPIEAGEIMFLPFFCTGYQIERAVATDGKDGYAPTNK